MTYNKDTLPLTDYHQYYRMKLLKGILPHLDKCLILIIIGIFSCKNEKNIEGIKINLLTIELDYHFLDYSLLRNSKEVYMPENLIFTFEILNMADKNFKESFYTKLNQNDSLFTFYLVSQMDTAKLFTLQDKLILEKNETIELSAELPFKSYNILKDGFIEVSKKGTANNLKEITIFLKKRSEKEFDVSIANANNPIVNLTCMDTLIALPLRLPGAVQ